MPMEEVIPLGSRQKDVSTSVTNFNDGIGGKSGERYLTKADMVYILKDT